MSGDYGQRAASALDHLLPREHRIKAVARAFNCSLRTARYLLAGDHWTARRLSQASELLGDAFEAAFNRPASAWTHLHELHDISTRLARLEQRLEQMDGGGMARVAPDQGMAAPVESRAPAACGGEEPAPRDDQATGDGARRPGLPPQVPG
jgi:hypothetical protein